MVSVITSDEMCAAVHEAVLDCDVLVMCAAVSDYKPARVAEQKIKKRDERFSLELIPARDILKSLPPSRNFFVVGFAAETNDVEEHARAKLATKNCDMMVANDLSAERPVGLRRRLGMIFPRSGLIAVSLAALLAAGCTTSRFASEDTTPEPLSPAPAGTVTPPDGVTTSPSILPFTHTDAPPAGAGAVSVTVPVVVCPPSTLGAATVTLARLGAGAGAPTGSSVSHVSGAR